MLNTKPKLALLVGGTSPERQVSKMSGKGVLGALKNLEYPTIIIGQIFGSRLSWFYQQGFYCLNQSILSCFCLQYRVKECHLHQYIDGVNS